MKLVGLLSLACTLLLSSCAPAGDLSGATIAPPSPTNSSPAPSATGDSLQPISLRVGRGVEGGWFQLFFTDPANPVADQLDGGPDGPLVDAIDASRLAVDAALYSLSLHSVRQALIRAHRRGVVVRVVMESDNMDDSSPQALKDAGIPIVGDRGQGLMHNKFMVLDASEVWTGSMNMTGSGTYSDRNNLIRIRSPKLAADYEVEFDEMFVDGRFGSVRGTPTPFPHLTLDGTRLDVYFSPDDHIQTKLLDLLASATSSIDFLAYSFTADPLGEAIRRQAKAGVAVHGVMDSGQMSTNTGSEYDLFRSDGLDVRLDGEDGLMHHKVMILDGEIVVLGSYNFTASAEKYNDENVIVIHNRQIASQYLQEFHRIYDLATP